VPRDRIGTHSCVQILYIRLPFTAWFLHICTSYRSSSNVRGQFRTAVPAHCDLVTLYELAPELVHIPEVSLYESAKSGSLLFLAAASASLRWPEANVAHNTMDTKTCD
jgi:hypothetical protein